MGTKIQVPTANLKTSHELIPRRGVYATLIRVDGCKYKGVTNIGVRPTVTGGEDATLSIETHILDFKQDIYGKDAALEFLFRLRDERRFSGVDALVQQIQKDIANSRRYFHCLDRDLSQDFVENDSRFGIRNSRLRS